MDIKFKSAIGQAVLKVLKPLVRVLIRNEITVADFMELARKAYVDVAHESYAIPGKKLTYARIAVLTGLNRKEVVRLDKLRTSEKTLTRTSPNRAQRVVNGWLSDEEFLTTKGAPRVLPLQGDTASFSALVARYSGDITLGAVLDELIRVGIVSRNNKDMIRLESHGYIPSKDELEKIEVMATCAADLLDSAVFNIVQTQQAPKFQRQVVYSNISETQAEQFREQSAELCAVYLQELNQLLVQARDKSADDLAKNPNATRIGVGIYYFENPVIDSIDT